ncbi:cupin domain-containing protein [Albirhodobacter sp. R86504]|jgi:quercetin dioxygenase-like cupin family protein|uniref:cupin domain-containing protein n=1 Tax=Albirhodobacter sp. R86504 TaxID=3093848 RepID=UPI00366F9DEB
MTFPIVETADGITRQVLSHVPEMMTVVFTFETGRIGALHSHPHVQSTYVKSGRFRFTIGDDTVEVGPGESLVMPSNVIHGCTCLEAGELIDGFTPRRDDFL